MQMRQPAFVDDVERVFEHRLGLGRKAGDQIGAEDHVGAKCAHLLAEANGVGAEVPPLHPLQDHVVAGLQRQVEMRHQPLFLGDRPHQVVVGLDAVDGGKPQPLEAGHHLEDRQRPARRGWALPGRSRAIGGDIDAGQHDFRDSRCRRGGGPGRRPRPSARSANCRGRRG